MMVSDLAGLQYVQDVPGGKEWETGRPGDQCPFGRVLSKLLYCFRAYLHPGAFMTGGNLKVSTSTDMGILFFFVALFCIVNVCLSFRHPFI